MCCEIEVNCGGLALALVVDVESFEVMTWCRVVVSVVKCATPSVIVEFELGAENLLVKGNCECVSIPCVVDGATEGSVEAGVNSWPSLPVGSCV